LVIFPVKELVLLVMADMEYVFHLLCMGVQFVDTFGKISERDS